ncbi:MAG: hypothetical protein ACQEQL_07080 [Pseudomonadota bacterium]
MFTPRSLFLPVIALTLCLAPVAGDQTAAAESRTAKRTVDADQTQARSLRYTAPQTERYWEWKHGPDFKHDMPDQWRGQEWDPQKWQKQGWSAQRTIANLFRFGAFEALVERNEEAFLHIGKPFFELSELDQRRSIKLIVDEADIFAKGYDTLNIYSEPHYRQIGTYRKSGLTLK